MGNKQGQELSPEERQKLKDQKEREKRFLKEQKERRKREKKEEKKRKKEKRYRNGAVSERGDEVEDDLESVGGSSEWSGKSDAGSAASAPGSWYHSASEPSSKRSSIYLPASAGPGYYQHECWYQGYEDSGSEKSKPPSRASSVKDTLHTLNLRSGSLERYPLGVPTGEPIEPLHKAGSLDLTSAAAKTYLKDRENVPPPAPLDADVAATIATRYDETIRSSRDHLERTTTSTTDRALFLEKLAQERCNATGQVVVDKTSQGERASLTDRSSITSSVYYSAEEGSVRGEKRKASLEGRESIGSVDDTKRKSLDYGSDRTSVTGSIYYSADEGGSIAGSVYYSATSGSEVEDHGDDTELLGKGKVDQ